METLGYSFTWLTKNSTEENKMFGQMNLAQFEGKTKMPQRAASAWSGAIEGLVGMSYKPLIYLGDQPVNGTLHWFIAEQTIPYKFEIRHVIKMAILEKDGEYKLDDKSITTCCGQDEWANCCQEKGTTLPCLW